MKMLSGNFAGTAAAIHVSLGFQPDFVKIVNATSRTELVYSGKDLVNTDGGIAIAADGTKTKASAGVTVMDNSAGVQAPASNTAYLIKVASGTYDYEAATEGDYLSDGFTLSASATVNASGEKLYFEAGMLDG